MTLFRECDEDGNEFFIERDKPGGMTHYEMRATGQRGLDETNASISVLESLRDMWLTNIAWNQGFIDKGEDYSPGMTHSEMLATAQRALNDVNARIKELDSLRGTYNKIIAWNQEFIDKGEGDVYS